MRRFFLIALLMAPFILRAQDLTSVVSPNGEVEFRLFSAQPEGALWGRIGYQVFYRGKPVLATSWLGLDIREQEPFLGENPGFMSADKAPNAAGHYNAAVAHYMQNGSLGRRLDIEIRAFNDGVAFRYLIPRSTPVEEILIRDEATQFNFPNPATLSHLPAQPDYDLPFAVEQPGAGWVVIAGQSDPAYPATYLVHTDTGMVTSLARSRKEPSIAYAGPTPLVWAWRAVLVGPDRERLLQSEALTSLFAGGK